MRLLIWIRLQLILQTKFAGHTPVLRNLWRSKDGRKKPAICCPVLRQLETVNPLTIDCIAASCAPASHAFPYPPGVHSRESHAPWRKARNQAGFSTLCKFKVGFLVELSGIEPLTSSLRIQDTSSDGETPDDTK